MLYYNVMDIEGNNQQKYIQEDDIRNVTKLPEFEEKFVKYSREIKEIKNADECNKIFEYLEKFAKENNKTIIKNELNKSKIIILSKFFEMRYLGPYYLDRSEFYRDALANLETSAISDSSVAQGTVNSLGGSRRRRCVSNKSNKRRKIKKRRINRTKSKRHRKKY